MTGIQTSAISVPADVLVVEDESVSRRALAMLLNLNGFTTAAVGSAEEALAIFDHQPWPETALVDLDLPGMSGLDLISRFQALGAKVHTVLLTAAEESRVRPALRGPRGCLYAQAGERGAVAGNPEGACSRCRVRPRPNGCFTFAHASCPALIDEPGSCGV